MQRALKPLIGSKIHARDGTIGHVRNLYLDDARWVLRYLVVETGGWLHGRTVLISPAAFESANWDEHEVSLALTRKQIEESPDVSTDLPISRQHEIELHRYYQWPAYYVYGLGSSLGWPYPELYVAPPGAEPSPASADIGDSHLESLRVLTGYELRAKDGALGHLDDCVADDDTWEVRWLVVDTHRWLPGRRVLISPRRVRDVNWSHSVIHVDLGRDDISGSPEFDPAVPASHEYEDVVFDFYGRPKSWRREGGRKADNGSATPGVQAHTGEGG